MALSVFTKGEAEIQLKLKKKERKKPENKTQNQFKPEGSTRKEIIKIRL